MLMGRRVGYELRSQRLQQNAVPLLFFEGLCKTLSGSDGYMPVGILFGDSNTRRNTWDNFTQSL